MIQSSLADEGPRGQRLRPAPWVLVGMLLLALVARLGFLAVVAHPEVRQGQFTFSENSDESDYHRMARNLAVDGVYKLGENGPPTAKRPPGMVLPMAALYAVGGASPWWGLAWVLGCSLLTVPVTARLVRACGSGVLAQTLAMGIAALLPTSVFTAAGLWSEPPALVLTLMALTLLVEARPLAASPAPNALRAHALAGLALGYATLVRPAAQAILVLSLIVLAVAAWRHRAPRPLLVFLLLVCLPLIPWGWRNQQVLGEFLLGNTESTAALWGANNPVTAGLEPPALARSGGYDLAAEAADGAYLGSWVPVAYLAPTAPVELGEIERHHWYRQQVRDFVRQHPGAFARLVGYKLWRTATAEPYAPSILGESPGKRRLKHLVAFGERWFLLLAGGWGLVLLWRHRAEVLPLYGAFLIGSASVVVLAYVNARIFLPVSGLLMAPAAIALAAGLHHRVPRLEPFLSAASTSFSTAEVE